MQFELPTCVSAMPLPLTLSSGQVPSPDLTKRLLADDPCRIQGSLVMKSSMIILWFKALGVLWPRTEASRIECMAFFAASRIDLPRLVMNGRTLTCLSARPTIIRSFSLKLQRLRPSFVFVHSSPIVSNHSACTFSRLRGFPHHIWNSA